MNSELCTDKFTKKFNYDNIKKNAMKTYIKFKNNPSPFIIIILAILFVIIFGFAIQASYKTWFTIIFFTTLSVLLLTFFPNNSVKIISVFLFTLIILGNLLTNFVNVIFTNIYEFVIFIIYNISDITSRMFKIDVNFQENYDNYNNDVSNIGDNDFSKREKQDSSSITHVTNTYKNLQKQKELDMIKKTIFDLEDQIKEKQNEVKSLDIDLNEIANDVTGSQLLNDINSLEEQIKTKQNEYKEKSKVILLQFDRQGNKIPSTLPIYNKPNKYTYGTQAYIPSYEDKIMLTTLTQEDPGNDRFIYYKPCNCLIYDNFNKE
jgi:hypothetical protein